MKDIIKDTEEQRDDRVQRAKSRRVLSARAQGKEAPWRSGVPSSQDVDVFIDPEALRTLWFWDFHGNFIT